MGNKRGSGQIRKRSDGRFEWRYTDGIDPKTGKLIRKSVYGKTWSECDRKRRQNIAEKEQYGKVLSPSSVTVEQWAQRWLDVYCDQLKDSTKKDYASRIRNGISQIGKSKLKDLTNEDVQKWVNDLSRELAPKTVKNYHGVLHDALQTAVELGMIRKNPADNIILPKVGDYDMQTLPRTDVKLFLEALGLRAHMERCRPCSRCYNGKTPAVQAKQKGRGAGAANITQKRKVASCSSTATSSTAIETAEARPGCHESRLLWYMEKSP